MRHTDADFLHPEIAATLDDLFERRNQGLAPSRPKRLVPVNFTSQKFSKPSDSTSLLRIARLPSRGEGDLLVAPFDALLDPAFLRGVGDVHELDAERLAIRAAQDGDDLAH